MAAKEEKTFSRHGRYPAKKLQKTYRRINAGDTPEIVRPHGRLDLCLWPFYTSANLVVQETVICQKTSKKTKPLIPQSVNPGL